MNYNIWLGSMKQAKFGGAFGNCSGLTHQNCFLFAGQNLHFLFSKTCQLHMVFSPWPKLRELILTHWHSIRKPKCKCHQLKDATERYFGTPFLPPIPMEDRFSTIIMSVEKMIQFRTIVKKVFTFANYIIVYQ